MPRSNLSGLHAFLFGHLVNRPRWSTGDVEASALANFENLISDKRLNGKNNRISSDAQGLRKDPSRCDPRTGWKPVGTYCIYDALPNLKLKGKAACRNELDEKFPAPKVVASPHDTDPSKRTLVSNS